MKPFNCVQTKDFYNAFKNKVTEKQFDYKSYIALSHRAVEYTGCNSAEWYDTKRSDGEAKVLGFC